MQTVTLSWVEPVVRTDGKSLAKAEILNTEVFVSAVTNPPSYVSIGTVPAGGTLSVTKDYPDGNYVARFIVTDTIGQKSPSVDVPFTIKTPLAPPGPVTSAKAVVS